MMQQIQARADKLMIGIVWGLMGYSLALAPWHDTWTWAVGVGLPASSSRPTGSCGTLEVRPASQRAFGHPLHTDNPIFHA